MLLEGDHAINRWADIKAFDLNINQKPAIVGHCNVARVRDVRAKLLLVDEVRIAPITCEVGFGSVTIRGVKHVKGLITKVKALDGY